MKISKIIVISSVLFLASCSGKKADDPGHKHSTEEHGHEHNSDGHHDHHEQQEFMISDDSVKVEEPNNHMHNDGSEHHNH
jgi:hypothetical protein